jgi:hypothetical protein
LGRADLFTVIPQAEPLFFEAVPGGAVPNSEKKVCRRNPTFTRRSDAAFREQSHIPVSAESLSIFGVKILSVHGGTLSVT